ncbi:MAG: hypothetical protein B5M52_06095 [Helicobacteraceae bacterium 4484_230]|nr:MAG: hypothetical protein B5M52_06095 [Helicobacteraceae bacterium 4484_230]
MDERNELNDIILNKTDKQSRHKKILLAIATLAIILIVVIVIMNQVGNKGTSNLPKAHLPPENPKTSTAKNDDAVFEPVAIIEEKARKKSSSQSQTIDKALKRAKQKAKAEDTSVKETVSEEIVVVEQEELEPKSSEKPMEVRLHRKGEKLVIDVDSKKRKMSAIKPKEEYTEKPPGRQSRYREHVKLGATYIQVGSFSKYKPNKKFLNSITRNGFDYTYHRVVRNGRILNKVLIGPFKNRAEARDALMRIRKKIESDAFIITSLK